MTEILPATRGFIDEAATDLESYLVAADRRLAHALGRNDQKMEEFFRKEVVRLKQEVANLRAK